MNLSAVITSIRAAFQSAVPNVPVYLQLAPQEVQVPYAVMRVSSIDPGEGDTVEKDYSATVVFAVVTSSDTDCLASLDSISAAFDCGRVANVYSTLLNAASFDIQYAEQAAMWAAEASYSVRWTVRA